MYFLMNRDLLTLNNSHHKIIPFLNSKLKIYSHNLQIFEILIKKLINIKDI